MTRGNPLADLDGHRVSVEVPATSANLGAGYDTLALALEIVNRATVEAIARPGAGIELEVEGDGAGELPADRSNIFVAALERGVCEARGLPADVLAEAGVGWRITMVNRIPLSRGLGSSASVVVAGLLAGSALAGAPLSADRLLAIATEIEGHPDNAAAAVLGGFTVAAHDGRAGGGPRAVRFDAPRDLRTILFIPEARLATKAMRAVLPETVPLRDAVANLQAVGLGVAGLATGRSEFLGHLTVDRLHEPYRAAVYPQLPVLVGCGARRRGALGACMSGAGSTIIAFADSLRMITRVEGAFRAAAGGSRLRRADGDRPAAEPRGAAPRARLTGGLGGRRRRARAGRVGEDGSGQEGGPLHDAHDRDAGRRVVRIAREERVDPGAVRDVEDDEGARVIRGRPGHPNQPVRMLRRQERDVRRPRGQALRGCGEGEFDEPHPGILGSAPAAGPAVAEIVVNDSGGPIV